MLCPSPAIARILRVDALSLFFLFCGPACSNETQTRVRRGGVPPLPLWLPISCPAVHSTGGGGVKLLQCTVHDCLFTTVHRYSGHVLRKAVATTVLAPTTRGRRVESALGDEETTERRRSWTWCRHTRSFWMDCSCETYRMTISLSWTTSRRLVTFSVYGKTERASHMPKR